MAYFISFKSGQQLNFVPQIRLTCSKNGITGTAIFEIDLEHQNFELNNSDPICNICIRRHNHIKMADISQFLWSSGRPIRLIGIFIFSTIEEKQKFFDYYSYSSINNGLEFLPAQRQEKTLNKNI
jgi:hypothetical protein